MNFTCKMKIQNLFLEGEGCKATLRSFIGSEYSPDYTVVGTMEIVVHRPKKVQGTLALGEVYNVTFTPVPEEPNA